MKKVLIFLILLSPLFLFGQQYHRIVKNYAVWGMEYGHFEPDDPSASTISFSYYIMYGDTIINNYSYMKLYKGLFKDTIEIHSYIGVLREDSLGDVYIKCSADYFLFNDSLEHLLYRFSLNVGDTLFGVNQYVPLFVKKIDSILVNGTYRKRIEFKQFSPSAKRVWIEGIGSTKGLLFPVKYLPAESFQDLICYSDSNTTWPSNFQCGGLGIIDYKRESYNTYPNPVVKIINFNISSSAYEEYDINIFNVLGIEINGLNIYRNAKTYSIDVSNFETGIYFYQVISKEGKVKHSGKFIKL